MRLYTSEILSKHAAFIKDNFRIVHVYGETNMFT